MANKAKSGHWMTAEMLNRLPNVHREFDMNRDPHIRAQLLDLAKTETRRREEQTGRGSSMVGQEKPRPQPRPRGNIAKSVARGNFNRRWLNEARDAAKNKAPTANRSHEISRDISRDPRGPSR